MTPRDELAEACRALILHARRIRRTMPHVCCWVDCPQRGMTDARCGPRLNPSGRVGMGSSIWEEIERVAEAVDGIPS